MNFTNEITENKTMSFLVFQIEKIFLKIILMSVMGK